MIRAVPLVALFLSLPAFSAFSQENNPESATSLPSSKRDFMEDDELPPPKPAEDSSESSLRPTHGIPQERKSEVPLESQTPTAIVSVKPQAVAAKLAIRDALARNDGPAARRLFADALTRFPDDPDLREVRDGQMLELHAEKVRAVFDRTLTESRKLFGRQWLPGRSMDEGEWNVELDKQRSHGSRPLAPGTGVRAALSNGYALIIRGDSLRAEQVLSGAIKKNADAAPLYYARVMTREMSGNFKGADEDSLKAVALSHEHSAALSQRALLMMQLRRREEAFAWADRALKSDPGDADALAVRGRFLWQNRGQYDLALADIKQAAQISPGNYGTLYQEAQRRLYGQRALSALRKGDDKRALEDADRALAGDAGDSTAHRVRGAVFSRAGKLEETIKETTLALKGDKRSGDALLYRGMALEALGQRGRALADFKRAAEIDPGQFRRFYELLVKAQRDGEPPLWRRKRGGATASN